MKQLTRPQPLPASLFALSPLPYAAGNPQQSRSACPSTSKKYGFRQRHLVVIGQFENVLTALENGGLFDFTQSRHKNGLKVGGLMLNCTKDLNVYASFRNHCGECAEISLMQDTNKSKPYLVVSEYQIRTGLPRIERQYRFADLHAAFNDYCCSIKAIH